MQGGARAPERERGRKRERQVRLGAGHRVSRPRGPGSVGDSVGEDQVQVLGAGGRLLLSAGPLSSYHVTGPDATHPSIHPSIYVSYIIYLCLYAYLVYRVCVCVCVCVCGEFHTLA